MNTHVYPIKVAKLFFKNYCYLVVDIDTHDAVLIDPAWEMDKIEQYLAQSEANLKAVLLTHHHPDHINLADAFAKKYQIPVMMSQIEIEHYAFNCTNLTPIATPDLFHIGGLDIVPLFTPGHTKGAISFWIENALFPGDTLFIEGCGMCYGKGSDAGELFDSLSYLQTILPINTKIYPGHSYGKEPGEQFEYLLEANIYLQFKDRQQFIEFRMRKAQHGLLDFK